MMAAQAWFRTVGALAVAVALAAPAGAQVRTYAATLDGANENPANVSTGVGQFMASYDPTTSILSINMSFSGLISPTSISHIHCCTMQGNNVGVSTPLPSFPGFPAGVMAGTYSNTFDLSLAASFNPAFVTAQGGSVDAARAALLDGMATGMAYINIHSQRFPGGEIRGFITETPEPSTYVLMTSGLAMVGGLGWRRRRAS